MKIIKTFVLRNIAGESVLVPTGATTQEFNGLISMTDSAQYIWENLEKTESLDDLVNMVVKEFEIDYENARVDVGEFIDFLLAKNFVAYTDEMKKW